MNILILAIALFLMSISVIASYNTYKTLANPVFYCQIGMALSIIMALASGLLSPNQYYKACAWLTLGDLLFVGAFITTQRFSIKVGNIYLSGGDPNQDLNVTYSYVALAKLTTCAFIFGLICVLLNTYTILQITPNLASIFVNSTKIRFLYLQRSQNRFVTFASLLSMMLFLASSCAFPEAIKKKIHLAKIKLFFCICFSLYGSLITMSKEAFIVYLIIVISSYLASMDTIEEELSFLRKNVIWIIIAVIVLLVVISMQRGYVEQGRYGNYKEAVSGTITRYLGNTTVAFGLLIDKPSPSFFHGQQTFRPIINILSYVFGMQKTSIIQEAINSDVGNVYTAFGNFFNDFGFSGIITLSIIMGTFLGILYQKKKSNKISIVVKNSIVNFTMFFMFYDFELMQTVYLFVIIVGYILEALLKKEKYIQIES